jgi:hypothetical protein
MKFLFHDSHATYNADNKEYIYTLSTRIRAPTTMTLENVSFTAGTMSDYPPVVYLRSNALSGLIRGKHCVQIQSADSHDHQVNVIAVLQETHTKGRYEMKDRSKYRLDPNRTCAKIDFFFTDGDTRLSGEAAVSDGGGTATDDDITAIHTAGKLMAWTDLDNSRMFDTSMIASTGAGSNINYIYDRLNSSLIWSLAYGNNMKVVALGEHQGIYRDGSWQSMVDGSPATLNLEEEHAIHFIFQHNSLNDFTMLFYFTDLKLAMYQGALTVIDGSNTYIPVTGIGIIPLNPYLVSVHRRIVDLTVEHYYRVEKLSDGTFQESTSVPTTAGTLDVNQSWRLGAPNTHFNHYQGAFIIHNDLDAAHINDSRDWLRAKHGGTVAEEESSSSVNASFNVVLNINAN